MNLSKTFTPEILIALFAATVLLVGALFWADQEPRVEKTDFSVTYIASRMVYVGLGPKLYDLAEQRKLKDSVLKYGEPLIFEHPPFEAFLLSPLGALPYRTAYLLWGLINISIWLNLPWLLRPYASVPRDTLGYLGLWLLFAPLGVAMFQGQSSLVMLLLYSVAFICLRRGRDFRAGLALGLALIKFQFALPLVLILLLRRKWTFFRGFLTMAAALGVLSFVAVGWNGIWGYFQLITNVAVHPDNSSFGAAVGMATVEGFIHAMLRGELGRFVLFLIVSGISGSLILWTAMNWNRTERIGDRQSSDLMFAAAVVVSLVTGFHMFTHDLSPLMLAMLLVSAHLSSSPPALRFALRGCLTLFWIPPIYFTLLAWHSFYLLFPVLLFFAFGSIKLAARLGSVPPSIQQFSAVKPVQRASEI